MTTLIPTEKPAQAKMIAAILGAQADGIAYTAHRQGETYHIVPLRGHIMDVPELWNQDAFRELLPDKKWFRKKREIVEHPAFPLFPEPFEYYPRTVSGEPDYKRRFAAIAKFARQSDRIVLAVDPDYEGAALVYNVLYACNASDKISGAVNMQSTSTATIKKNLLAALREKPVEGERYDKLLATIGLIRRDIDYALGINTTIYASATANAFFPFGTQKARLMWEIIRRNQQIKGFDVAKYYVVSITTEEGYKFDYLPDDKEERFDKEAMQQLYERVKGTTSLRIDDLSEQRETKKSPEWFDGITLGQMGAKALKKKLDLLMSRTSGILQKMYQKQLIGYPGTEGRIMPLEEFDKYAAIAATFAQMYPNARYDFTLKKKHLWAADGIEANHIPVSVVSDKPFTDRITMTPDEEVVFKIAVRHLLSVFLPDGIERKLKALSHIEGHAFRYAETYDEDIGWQELYGKKPREKKFRGRNGERLAVVSVDFEEKETEPPRPYTTKAGANSLATMMKKKGIGTDNTIAKLIENVFEQGYVFEDAKNRVYPTEKGEFFWGIFPADDLLAILERLKTDVIPQLEKRKIGIRDAIEERDRIIADAWSVILSKRDELKNAGGKFSNYDKGGRPARELGNCPVCKNGAVSLKKGKRKDGSAFAAYACSNRDCDLWINEREKAGYGSVKYTESNIEKLIKNPGKATKVTFSYTTRDGGKKTKKIDATFHVKKNKYKRHVELDLGKKTPSTKS